MHRLLARRTLATSVFQAPPGTTGKVPIQVQAPETGYENNIIPPELTRQSGKARSVFVKPWDGVISMAHAFAIVRKIEEKYGQVEDFILPRDTETSAYNPYFWLTFASQESYEALGQSTHLEVPYPKIDTRRDGGIGLDDLNGLLKIEPGGTKWDEVMEGVNRFGGESAVAEVSSPVVERKWMDVKIEKAERNFAFDYRKFNTATKSRIGRQSTMALYRGFESFTGFAPEPTPAMQALATYYRRMAESRGIEVSPLQPATERQQRATSTAPPRSYNRDPAPHWRNADNWSPELPFTVPNPSTLAQPPSVPLEASHLPTPRDSASSSILSPPEQPSLSFSNSAPHPIAQPPPGTPLVIPPTIGLADFKPTPAPPPLTSREKQIMQKRLAKMVESQTPSAGNVEASKAGTSRAVPSEALTAKEKRARNKAMAKAQAAATTKAAETEEASTVSPKAVEEVSLLEKPASPDVVQAESSTTPAESQAAAADEPPQPTLEQAQAGEAEKEDPSQPSEEQAQASEAEKEPSLETPAGRSGGWGVTKWLFGSKR